jgi:Domain of unknown function (DUF4386)
MNHKELQMNPKTMAPTTRSQAGVPANATRKVALVVGVLFLATFVTSIAAFFAYGPVLTDAHYIMGTGSDTRVFLGAFLELLLIISNIGCALVLFPLLKRQNEAIALGYVAARLVEGTLLLIGILSVLAIVTLRQGTSGADAATLVTVNKLLLAIKNWTFLLGPGFMDGIGTGLMLGWLMYRSGLVSRRVSFFGVIGGPMLAVSGVAILFGLFKAGSPLQGIATIPEVIWEGYLALWLTFKGFNQNAFRADETTAVGADADPAIGVGVAA